MKAHDLFSSHEEASSKIIFHAMLPTRFLRNQIKMGIKGLIINYPDIDILVLAVHYYRYYTAELTLVISQQQRINEDTHLCTIYVVTWTILLVTFCLNFTLLQIVIQYRDVCIGGKNCYERTLKDVRKWCCCWHFWSPPLLTSMIGNGNIKSTTRTSISWVVRAHFSKRGILKVCKAFLSRICQAVVFTQFGYADSKSVPCQALFLKLQNKMAAKIADEVSIIMIIHHVWVHSGHTNLTFVFKITFLFLGISCSKTWSTITQKIQDGR